MIALIDGDILLYEVGWAAQPNNEPMDFEAAWTIWNNRLDCIRFDCGNKDEIIFFSDSPTLSKLLGRDYVPNFRIALAEKKEYKANRKSQKPFHYYNLLHTALASHNCRISSDGREADDELLIAQARDKKGTVVCSRDKDLRQGEGIHYSWESGRSASFGPKTISRLGYIEKTKKGKVNVIVGGGFKFLCAQALMGDPVDNIPGLKDYGPVATFELLKDRNSFNECYAAVTSAYMKTYGEQYYYHMREQFSLVFLQREEGQTFQQYYNKIDRWD